MRKRQHMTNAMRRNQHICSCIDGGRGCTVLTQIYNNQAPSTHAALEPRFVSCDAVLPTFLLLLGPQIFVENTLAHRASPPVPRRAR
jgi:hypothetical protein